MQIATFSLDAQNNRFTIDSATSCDPGAQSEAQGRWIFCVMASPSIWIVFMPDGLDLDQK